MPFLSITLKNFRNLNNSNLDLLASEVFFIGENGQGKSNLLETLYISAYGSSFRTRNETELCRNGDDSYSVKALYRNSLKVNSLISVEYSNGKKKIEKNEKRIQDRKDLVNTIPCVLFCHDDLSFADGEPERKRFFIDQTLSMNDPVYLDDLRRYKKILKSRNIILKNRDYKLLDVYDRSLAETGLQIVKKREKAVFLFSRLFSRLYENISSIPDVQILYNSKWKDISADEIVEMLLSRREMDMQMMTTTMGPHRDRIHFVKDKRDFISTASTGQRRLISLVLRAAQACYFSDMTGQKPVLLLDDVLLELDPDKRQKFMAMLPEYEQLICTFLTGEPFEKYKKTTTKVYTVDKGNWIEQR